MSEELQETGKSTQQIIVIFLVVIAVLLAALVVVMVMNKKPAASVSANGAGAQQQAPAGMGQQQAPAGMGQQPAAADTPFDPKTATAVAKGQTPEQWVKAYGKAVLAKEWETAFKMLPVDTQKNSYGASAKQYGEQLAAYGITDYKVGTPAEADGGNTVTIAAEQVTPQMPITYTWTFKKDGGQWYAAARAMGGTVK